MCVICPHSYPRGPEKIWKSFKKHVTKVSFVCECGHVWRKFMPMDDTYSAVCFFYVSKPGKFKKLPCHLRSTCSLLHATFLMGVGSCVSFSPGQTQRCRRDSPWRPCPRGCPRYRTSSSFWRHHCM